MEKDVECFGVGVGAGVGVGVGVGAAIWKDVGNSLKKEGCQ